MFAYCLARRFILSRCLPMFASAAFCFTAIYAYCAESAGQPGSEKERIIKQYDDALRPLKEFYSHITMTVKATYMPRGADGAKRVVRGTIATNGTLKMSDFVDVSNTGRQEEYRHVIVANPASSFSLVAATANSNLAVRAVGRPYPGNLASMRLDYRVFQAPFCFYELPIGKFLSEPEVVALSMEEDKRNG